MLQYVLIISAPQGRATIEYVDLIVFMSRDGVRNVAKHRFTALKKMGLTLHYEYVLCHYIYFY